ncbi:carbon-nitrogen hydrolase family protein [Jiangella endophytica]|uniref:carbon-nitrogen hydrolase family protein n=1 Tax=Jiangella endophytica TaxID=1623398 RepID=UPI0018E548C3|nr:carbon-nitrogen hydrolase family protein [Jiangella endophytica]
MRATLRIGSCQTPEFLGDVESALRWIEAAATAPAADAVDLLLFPECFLQGYLADEPHVRRHALAVDSPRFGSVLKRLGPLAPTLVFGLIERDGRRYFNSAVVVSRGRLAGVYRKTHLVPGESVFHAGDAYPTFELRGVRFGLNICYDTRFAEAAARVADQGARALLVPAQNMMRRPAAEDWKDRHHAIRAERARETGLWLVSADVTGARDEHRVGLGPTSVIDPRGEVVAQVPPLTTGMVVADVS